VSPLAVCTSRTFAQRATVRRTKPATRLARKRQRRRPGKVHGPSKVHNPNPSSISDSGRCGGRSVATAICIIPTAPASDPSIAHHDGEVKPESQPFGRWYYWPVIRSLGTGSWGAKACGRSPSPCPDAAIGRRNLTRASDSLNRYRRADPVRSEGNHQNLVRHACRLPEQRLDRSLLSLPPFRHLSATNIVFVHEP
jgi:hypothetical protein